MSAAEHSAGISDAEASQAAAIAQWGILAMAHEQAADWCARMARLAGIDNPAVRESCQRAYLTDFHDKFNEELIDEIGDFRETPFGIVGGSGQSDALTRDAKRRELEAERKHISEAQSFRRTLEAKAVLGTEAEKQEAYAALAELDDDEPPDPSDIEA